MLARVEVSHVEHAGEALRLASLLGFAGFFFLAATVLLGMATALDLWGDRVSGAVLEQLHLTCAVAGLSGLVGHIAAHTVRESGGLELWTAFVPFGSGGWIVASGVLAWLGLIAVGISVPFRRALGYRGWLRVHRAAYGAFGLMALHVVAASDEVGRLAVVGLAVIGVILAVLLAGRRRLRGTADFHPRPGPTPRVMELEP